MSAYLELLKRVLNNYIYLGDKESPDDYFTISPKRYDDFKWKIPVQSRPHTLLSIAQLDKLEYLLSLALNSEIPGDIIEAGVWQGGACIFMKALLNEHQSDKTLYLADTFAGIPKSKKILDSNVDNWEDRWIASLPQVKSNFTRYSLLDDKVVFLKGCFSRTLVKLNKSIQPLAFIRLDADSYESTYQALTYLYPLLSKGGFIYIDDWHLPSCRQAVMTYRTMNEITDRLETDIDCYWQKTL